MVINLALFLVSSDSCLISEAPVAELEQFPPSAPPDSFTMSECGDLLSF